MENGYFPMFFDIANKPVLLVGGGNINLRRVNTLLGFYADITVVSPSVKEELSVYEKEGKIKVIHQPFSEEMLEHDWFMVIAATNDAVLNHRICLMAKDKGFYANNASLKEDNDFYFPAIVREKDVVAGVCAGGKNHSLVRKVAAGMRIWLKGFLDD